jgi:hypothetical protein
VKVDLRDISSEILEVMGQKTGCVRKARRKFNPFYWVNEQYGSTFIGGESSGDDR